MSEILDQTVQMEPKIHINTLEPSPDTTPEQHDTPVENPVTITVTPDEPVQRVVTPKIDSETTLESRDEPSENINITSDTQTPQTQTPQTQTPGEPNLDGDVDENGVHPTPQEETPVEPEKSEAELKEIKRQKDLRHATNEALSTEVTYVNQLLLLERVTFIL
jgi:hypothetical protein